MSTTAPRSEAKLWRRIHAALPILVISACVILLWGLHLKDSASPNVDFYGFYGISHALRNLETPASFKRAPLYTSMLIPFAVSETPTPNAIFLGRILSLVGYILLGAALYLLLHRLTPRFAFPATFLFMLNPHYILFVALQPLADSWLSFGAVLGVLGLYSGAWGLGTLGLLLAFNARYDGIALLPALIARFRDQWKHFRFWLSIVACLAPVALWLLWGWSQTGHLSPYVDETRESGHSAWRFVAVMIYTFFASFLPQSLMLEETMFRMPNVALLAMFGVGAAWTIGKGMLSLALAEQRPFLISTLVFAVGYIMLHLWFAAALPRYTLPVNWLFYLGLAAFMEKVLREGFTRYDIAALLLMAISMLAALGLSLPLSIDWLSLIGFLIFVSWAIGYALPRWATIVLPSILALALYHSTSGRTYWVDAHLTRNAELIAFAQWFRQQPNPPRVAVFRWAWKHLVEVEQLPKEQIMLMPPEIYANPDEAIDWLKTHGATHILWNETEFYFERAAVVNPTYVASIRRNYGDAGISGSFIHKVHLQQISGWRAVQSWEQSGRRAILYQRVASDP